MVTQLCSIVRLHRAAHFDFVLFCMRVILQWKVYKYSAICLIGDLSPANYLLISDHSLCPFCSVFLNFLPFSGSFNIQSNLVLFVATLQDAFGRLLFSTKKKIVYKTAFLNSGNLIN